MKYSIFIVYFFICFFSSAKAQTGQNVRGKVVDKISQLPLPGANIVLADTGKNYGTSADANGNFRIEKINVGRRNLKVSCIGYKDVVVPIIVHSAKEVVLTIEMEESVILTGEVTISADSEKDAPLNKMTSVSARMFTVEETVRYAGSMNDPARMAKNFAGVMGSDETRNEIIIRGNSPTGLLWRMDDVDIPNPNHFSSQGTTGGPISMLNNNTLNNSDFLSAAFPAEYGNALSGVFDLKMKTGNNEKHEFTGQLSINGLEFGAEGPLTSSNQSSYLIHYRYADFTIVDKIVNLGISGVPKFQDISFKLLFPFVKGNISLFGLAGSSDLALLDKDADSTDLSFSDSRKNTYFGSDMATCGVSATWFMKHQAISKFIVSGFFERIRNNVDTLDFNDTPFSVYNDFSTDKRLYLKYLYSKKINPRLSLKTGAGINKMMFDLNSKVYIESLNEHKDILNEKINFSNGPLLSTIFNQWQYKFSEKITINTGVHILYFDLNKKIAVEPRAGILWEANPRHRFSLGYGLHSKQQSVITYLAKSYLSDGTYLQTNKKIGFTKAQHFVFGYDFRVNEFTRLKTETYFQYLYNVPVETRPSSFSMLNTSVYPGEYELLVVDSLSNTGTGKNYGVEITLERFFHKNFYFLTTASFFNSSYKGSDGKERNTQFNSNYIFNFLIGKEFKIAANKTLFVDFKTTFAGGKRYTPIDLEKSMLKGETIRDESLAFSKQYEPYWKGDIKFGVRIEGKKFSQEIAVNADNFTNHKNILWDSYNHYKQKIETQYQFGIMPGGYYRIYF